MKTEDVSKILDAYLAADGVGTDREQLRMNLHREISQYVYLQVTAERERIKECIRAREIRVDPMFYLAYQDIYKIIDSL